MKTFECSATWTRFENDRRRKAWMWTSRPNLKLGWREFARVSLGLAAAAATRRSWKMSFFLLIQANYSTINQNYHKGPSESRDLLIWQLLITTGDLNSHSRPKIVVKWLVWLSLLDLPEGRTQWRCCSPVVRTLLCPRHYSNYLYGTITD